MNRSVTQTTPSPAAALPPRERTDRRYVVAATLLVMVLASMEQTVTSTAMPTIIGELHGLEHYAWVASVYLLCSTITMPLYGRLADALGRKRVVLGAIMLFAVGSVLSGAAQTMIQLVIFRGIQGLGAGGIMPVVLTIIGDLFTLEERAKIQGLFSAVWGTAGMAGPAAGAFLVHAFGWRSIFYVNLPFGLLGLIVLWWKYHEHEERHAPDLDLPGVFTLAAGCMTMLLLVSRIGPGGWSLPMGVALGALAVGLIGAFIWHERRVEHPVLPPSLITHRIIGPALAGNFLLGLAYLSLDTYVPLYVQGGKGGTAAQAAGVVTPVVLAWALSMLLAAPMVVRSGFRLTAMLGSVALLIGFVGLYVCALFTAPSWALTAVLFIAGLGMGPCSMAYILGAQEAVDYQQRGSVTSSVTFFRTIGGAMGIGLLGALFNILMAPDLSRLSSQGVTAAAALDPKQHHTVPPEALAAIQHAIRGSLVWVFAVMAALVALQGCVTFLMPKGKAQHRPRAGEAMEAMG